MKKAWPAQRSGYLTPPVLITLALIVFFVAASLYANAKLFPKTQPPPSSPSPQYPQGQDIVIKGTVTKNETSKLSVDRPAWLEVQTATEAISILYHSGEAECLNQKALQAGLKIQPGDIIEAFGKFLQNSIYTCDSTKYYIKKLTQ